jgi:hypothetical protein
MFRYRVQCVCGQAVPGKDEAAIAPPNLTGTSAFLQVEDVIVVSIQKPPLLSTYPRATSAGSRQDEGTGGGSASPTGSPIAPLGHAHASDGPVGTWTGGRS